MIHVESRRCEAPSNEDRGNYDDASPNGNPLAAAVVAVQFLQMGNCLYVHASLRG